MNQLQSLVPHPFKTYSTSHGPGSMYHPDRVGKKVRPFSNAHPPQRLRFAHNAPHATGNVQKLILGDQLSEKELTTSHIDGVKKITRSSSTKQEIRTILHGVSPLGVATRVSLIPGWAIDGTPTRGQELRDTLRTGPCAAIHAGPSCVMTRPSGPAIDVATR